MVTLSAVPYSQCRSEIMFTRQTTWTPSILSSQEVMSLAMVTMSLLQYCTQSTARDSTCIPSNLTVTTCIVRGDAHCCRACSTGQGSGRDCYLYISTCALDYIA